MVVGNDGALATLVEICTSIGDEDTLCAEQQLGGELFVLMPDAGGEAQVAQDGTSEEIAAGRAVDVVAAHVVAAALQLAVGIVDNLGSLAGKVEDHHLGCVEAKEINAMLIRCLQKTIVAVDKLDIRGSGHADAGISRHAQSLMWLADVDDI